MRFLAALLLALVSTPALAADTGMLLAGVSRPSASAYTGPGDIVSGATAFYGLRAYSAAVAATGTQKAVNVRSAKDNSTQDILILTSGNLDTASAATFAGTDATATCSTTGSSTTLACTGASSTPHANDPISGGGITQPAYIASCGTFTAGAGSCMMNVAQNIGVAETVTFQVALFVTEWYDQSGNTKHLLQPTAGLQPQMLPLGDISLPAMLFTSQYFSAASITAVNSPQTFSAVMNSSMSGIESIMSSFVGGSNATFQTASAGLLRVYAGSVATFSASANAWHSVNVVANTAGTANVDGTETSINTGSGATSTSLNVGSDPGGGTNAFTGNLSEIGMWPVGFSSGNRTSMCHNQFVYWGTPTSC